MITILGEGPSFIGSKAPSEFEKEVFDTFHHRLFSPGIALSPNRVKPLAKFGCFEVAFYVLEFCAKDFYVVDVA